jgi:hypothetical protein
LTDWGDRLATNDTLAVFQGMEHRQLFLSTTPSGGRSDVKAKK